jgi:WD40 repeat protein
MPGFSQNAGLLPIYCNKDGGGYTFPLPGEKFRIRPTVYLQYYFGTTTTRDERRDSMSQLLSSILSVSVLTILTGQSLRAEEPRNPTARTDALPAGAVNRFGTSRFLNYGRVFSVAFSFDGRTLAAGSWDGTVRLWEVSGGKELRQFDKQQAPVRSVAFSPDGKMLACGGEGSKIVLWDAATGKELRRLAGHHGPITFVMFSPDGKLLASKGYDQTLRLWNVADGREVRRLGHQEGASQVNEPDCPVVFSLDGKTVASATLTPVGDYHYQRSFRSWDVATGTETQSFKENHSSLGVAAFSPDGKLVAVVLSETGRLRQRICLWDVDNGKELRPIEPTQAESLEPVSFLAFSPDGKTLASSGGGSVQLWEVATRREACRFQAHDTAQSSLTFSPDGRLLASGSTDITVLLWDVTGRMQRGRLRPAELSPHEFQSLWADLESPDAAKARRARWAMVAAGGPSVGFLRERLHPAVSPANAETIARLVVELDSAQFPVRTKAVAQLVQLAELAEPALREAQQHHPSLELRQRIEQLLSTVADQRSRPTGERLRNFRAIEILEQIGTPEARQLLATLSQGASGALLTQEAKAALLRLSRQAIVQP